MRALAVLPMLTICTAASAGTCVLNEDCNSNDQCQGDQLSIEFVGDPPERLQSNFGDFAIETTSRAGEASSTLVDANGTEWIIKSENDLLIASHITDGERAFLYLTRVSPHEVTATLISAPQRYVDYNSASSARRVFTGRCEQKFL